MSTDSSDHSAPILLKKKVSFWRRLGGGSLTISIIVHAILLAVGIFLVVSIIPPEPEKVVDFAPSGGGGGSPASKPSQQKRNMMMKSVSSRIAATGASSTFTLPEPDVSSDMTALGSLGSSGGLGGSGSGGGLGSGKGTGIGSGMGPGMGTAGGKGNPFGMLDPSGGALVGAFYDLKQTPDRKPTNMTPDGLRAFIRDFTANGWKERDLDNYYKADRKLYQGKIYIPLMSAEEAPAAFKCEKEVQASRWIVIYRGTVTPPKSGRFRFVGGADDVLVVRFDGKHVFDHGWTKGTIGAHRSAADGKGEMSERDYERLVKKNYPMEDPLTFYQYTTTKNYNGSVKGLAVGPVFTAKAGTPYPIEILISEVPGGRFCASLLIEETGEKYEKDALDGSPILPLFRVDATNPVAPEGADVPPFDPKGPVWKILKSGGPKI